MLTYEEALDTVLQTIRPLPEEELPLPEALGRDLAEDVAARWDMPPADNSAMDGYAFAHAGLSPEGDLRVIGLSRAGAGFDGEVPLGAAVKIMTGAPLPGGCDTVVPLEEVEELEGGIRLRRRGHRGDHVRYRGEEFRGGEMLLSAGTILRAGGIGLLASAGVARVRVHRQPRVGYLGFRNPMTPRCRAILTKAVRGGGSRQSFIWGHLEEEHGRYLFTPTPKQGSGQNRSLPGAQALLPVSPGIPDLAAGEEVEVMLIYLPER